MNGILLSRPQRKTNPQEFMVNVEKNKCLDHHYFLSSLIMVCQPKYRQLAGFIFTGALQTRPQDYELMINAINTRLMQMLSDQCD